MSKRAYFLLSLLIAAVVLPAVSMAQARVRRSEFICYDKREDAKRDIRQNIDKYIA